MSAAAFYIFSVIDRATPIREAIDWRIQIRYRKQIQRNSVRNSDLRRLKRTAKSSCYNCSEKRYA